MTVGAFEKSTLVRPRCFQYITTAPQPESGQNNGALTPKYFGLRCVRTANVGLFDGPNQHPCQFSIYCIEKFNSFQ